MDANSAWRSAKWQSLTPTPKQREHPKEPELLESESASCIWQLLQLVPLNSEHAGVHSRPCFLQLQRLLVQPLLHEHFTIPKRGRGTIGIRYYGPPLPFYHPHSMGSKRWVAAPTLDLMKCSHAMKLGGVGRRSVGGRLAWLKTVLLTAAFSRTLNSEVHQVILKRYPHRVLWGRFLLPLKAHLLLTIHSETLQQFSLNHEHFFRIVVFPMPNNQRWYRSLQKCVAE